MLIREFYLQRYGPVRERHLVLKPGLNIITGANEDGKTLTIDALVKLLLGQGRELKSFDGIRRVDEVPEGYLILETGGRDFKIPEQGDLPGIASLSSAECRNIFVIRDSNLSIAKESDFYAAVTDRLTGLRTVRIGEIRRKLLDTAAITSTGQFRNTGDERLKSRLDDAEQLAAAAGELHEKLVGEGFDELEREQVACAAAIDEAESRLAALGDAYRREQYEKYSRALRELRESREAVAAARLVTPAGEREWSDAARDMSKLEQEIKRLEAGLREREKELQGVEKELRERRRDFRRIADRQKSIDEEIKPELINYTARREELARHEGKARLYTATGVAAVAVLSLSLGGLLLAPLPLFYITAALAVPATLLAWLQVYRLARERGAAAVSLERVTTLLSRYGGGIRDNRDPYSFVQELTSEHAAAQDELSRLQEEAAILSREIKTLRDETIPSRERELAENKAEIDRIRGKTGHETLRQYTARLLEKQQAEQAAARQAGVLESIFGSSGSSEEENAAAWTARVEELSAYRDDVAGLRHDPAEAASLEERKLELVEKQRSAARRMESVAKELGEIGREANRIMQRPDSYLHCQTTGDLALIRETLLEFVHSHRRNREDALAVLGIFEAIELEERARVAELFGEESPVSRWFGEITGGLYRSVSYDGEAGRIVARRRDGAELGADMLSGGAHDQLYLAVRLALAEKLLVDEKGFFIMDDPFIKSDAARLRRQLQLLAEIAAAGWQFIYFSAKDEVTGALKKEIKSGLVHHLSVKSLF